MLNFLFGKKKEEKPWIKTVDVPDGAKVELTNGELKINGKTVIDGLNIKELKLIAEGNINTLKTEGSAIIYGDIEGPVDVGGSLQCDFIEGNVKSGGSIQCDDIDGNVESGGSLNCDTIAGDVKARGSVNCDTIEGSVSR